MLTYQIIMVISELYNQSLIMACLTTPHKIALTPLDTIANNYHVFGYQGKKKLMSKINTNGYKVLFNGGSTIVCLNVFSSFLWFNTLLILEDKTKYLHGQFNSNIINGFNGMASSIVSDTFTIL